jgi:hypothetical protein
MKDHDIGVGLAFAPDNACVREVVEEVDGGYALFFGQPSHSREPRGGERVSRSSEISSA